MDSAPTKPQPERQETDESLRTERSSTDEVMAEQLAIVQEDADVLLRVAREQADAVLEAARQKADEKMSGAALAAPARLVVDQERAREDEILRAERAAADAALEKDREEQARALASLMPLEREKTDRYLLTERVRADKALAHRDDFMGMVSHDLRTLLSGIVLNASLLSQQASASEEGQRIVAGMTRMQSYVARMNRLIGDLVDVVSIDAGKLAVRTAPCDAAMLIDEAVDAFSQAAATKGVSLQSALVERALVADFDRERMLQVLANLITNAIKFTSRGGAVVVRGEFDAEQLRFSVTDNGAGIAEQMLESVFVRFWQVGKNDERGLGLGLYISKCIVEAHGGKIWAESKVGHGSTFHVMIPRTLAPDSGSIATNG